MPGTSFKRRTIRSRRARKCACMSSTASCGPLIASTAAHCEICDAQDSVFVIQRVNTGASARLDRKSTRLNSSHPSISYAVFCLKKKKKDNKNTKSQTNDQ